MKNRRDALSLAAVLAAATLTGGTAILGLVHRPAQHVAQPSVVQHAPPAQPQQHWEEGD